MAHKATLIRKTFPKIRDAVIKGQTLYVVDARKRGTSGKREYFTTQKAAITRAGEIVEELGLHGTEALVSSMLRNMALQGEAVLKPYGKTIADAVAHYTGFLDAENMKANSKTIGILADEWETHKTTGSNRKLKPATIASIKQQVIILKAQWADMKLLAYTEKHLQSYLDSLPHGQRRKFNIRSLTSQFFNWCIAAKYTTINPVEDITITVPRTKIHVLTPEKAKHCLQVCVEKHPTFTLYVAICLFAGLRPDECRLLTWENIHTDEKQITVLDETSKVAETRNVPIEPTLLAWLEAYKGERKGFVTRQTNFSNKIKQVRADCGYKVNGKNESGEEWKEDAFRHTYASYWLAKHKDRAHLAEYMGTSLAMIKRHYKQVISNSAQVAFWKLTPGFKEEKEVTEAEIKSARGKRLAAALG